MHMEVIMNKENRYLLTWLIAEGTYYKVDTVTVETRI